MSQYADARDQAGKIIYFLERTIAHYQHRFNVEWNPAILRELGKCVCLEWQYTLEQLQLERGEPVIPHGWTVIDGKEVVSEMAPMGIKIESERQARELAKAKEDA